MTNGATVKVWDIFVRIFHWSLLVAFVIAYLTAEEANPVHIYSGYTVLGLITFRILWGIVGSKHARFTDFIYSPLRVVRYLKSIFTTQPEHYLGHNPAGGYMVIAFLVSLFVVTISGLKLYAVEEGLGPLAEWSQSLALIDNAHADRDEYDENDNVEEEEGEEFWEELHEVSTNITLVLILMHILGVMISSYVHRENLVMAMITGNKKRKDE